MTLALPNYYKILLLALTSTVVLFACFFMMPQPARAEELTEEQIDAVLNLLESFNASDTAVKGVEAALRGEGEIEAAEDDDDEDEDEDEDEDDDDGDGKKSGKNLKGGITTSGKGGHVGRRAALCPRFIKPLWQGLRDDDPESPDIEELQKFLAAFYGLSEEDVATGYFGPLTHWLLVNFQEEEGLPAHGYAGELTKGKVLKYCLHELDNRGKGNAKDRMATSTPVCTLTASEDEVASGESVTLKWKSKNATYASSQSGDKDPVEGAVVVAPTETTVYKKTVYGPGGSASCTVEVEVEGDGDEATTTPPVQVVMQLKGDPLSQVASAALGVAALPFIGATEALTEIFLALGIY